MTTTADAPSRPYDEYQNPSMAYQLLLRLRIENKPGNLGRVTTAIGGAAIAVGVILLGGGGIDLIRLLESPVRLLFQTSPFMGIVFLLLAVAGIVVQIRANRRFEIETYNRFAETM